MAGQTGGRWDNMQENAFILLALRHYYDTFESADAPTSSPASGSATGSPVSHRSRATPPTGPRSTIPTASLVSGANDDVTVHNDGAGRLYYRLGLQTAPAESEARRRWTAGSSSSRTYGASTIRPT